MNFCIDEALVIKFLDYSQNIYIDFCYVLIDVYDITKEEMYSFHFRKEAICQLRKCNSMLDAKLEMGVQISVAQGFLALFFPII